MKKLASFKYDVLDYILAGEFSKVASLISGLSDSAKNANVPDFNESQERPNSDFALVLDLPEGGQIKKYACYTPELTELSMVFLSQVGRDLPTTIRKTAAAGLVKAAASFNLEVPTAVATWGKAEVLSNEVTLTKVADFSGVPAIGTSRNYAWQEEGRYPISTPGEIKKAAEYFENFFPEMAPWKAIEFAKATSNAANDYGISLRTSPNLQKFASLNLENKNSDIRELILSRQSFVKQDQPATLAKYASLAESVKTASAEELLEQLTALDVETSLNLHWGSRLTHPAPSVYAVKTASYGGPSLDALRGLSDEALTAVTGNDIITALKSDEGVDVYHTLPTPIRKEVDSLLSRK